ncbi:ankyrin repeat domain-containing protein [Shewanella sp. MF05960]|uniref:ankyrin repeat domain-containing protein n=1 Tax=Shewanella sp. MF05960 TaxID=3434874 RepID=UPI003D7A8DA3
MESNKTQSLLFDTNVLLINPDLLNQFSRRVILPQKILDELDYRKTKAEHQEKAQLCLHHIEKHRLKAVSTQQRSGSSRGNNDDIILTQALSHTKAGNIQLISNDVGMRNRAQAKDIAALSLDRFLQQSGEADSAVTPARQALFELLLRGDFVSLHQQLASQSEAHFNFYLSTGLTPLMTCIQQKKLDAIDFLLSLPSTELDLIDKAKLKITAFCHAAQRRQLNTMDKLLHAGANPYITSKGNNRGNSAILIAAWDGALNVIQFIHGHTDIRFSLNQADNNGFTPLIKASIKGNDSIVSYLLEQGVDIDIRDRNDKSALDYAKEKGHQKTVTLLQGKIHG